MIYKEKAEEVSKKLDLPLEVVEAAYESFWLFIRESIKELPLKEDLTEEEFKDLQPNFNIPSLGKLNCTYDRYTRIKNRYKLFKKFLKDDDNKED